MLTRRTLLAAALAPGAPRAAGFQRGVNFTAEQPDKYDSPKAVALLESLPQWGVNAVALVPYGFSSRGRGEVRFGGNRVWERDDDIARLAGIAHQKGIKVLLKPQIWVGGGYPGNLEYASEGDRAAWFTAYRKFLEHYAELATAIRADVFSVGVEFVRLTVYEKEWRSLITRARQLYSGPLTYGATQGQEFEGIAFWDALDYIGLNCYYPLPDNLDTRPVLAKVQTVQQRFRKPVIFPEAGYSSVAGCHREPWAEEQAALSLEAQSRCYDALMQAFYRQPWFQGVYWWKVGTNGFGGPQDRSHTPWNKPAMDVVKRWYRQGGR